MRKKCWNGGVKVLKTKAWAWNSGLISNVYDIKKYRNQVWDHRKKIKSAAETQNYTYRESQMGAATMYL